MKNRLVGSQRAFFIGKFNSSEEALGYSSTTTNYSLSGSKLEEVVVYYASNGEIQVSGRFCLVPLLLSSNEKNTFSILDVGGGVKPIHPYIKQSTNKEVKSVIIEEKDFIYQSKVKTIYENDENIKFITSLNEISIDKFDLIYFGSSIQYFTDGYAFFENMVGYNPDYIVFTGTAFNNSCQDFYVLHTSPVMFPYKLYSYEKMSRFFEKKGYELIFKTKRDQGSYTHNFLDENAYSFRELVYKKTFD